MVLCRIVLVSEFPRCFNLFLHSNFSSVWVAEWPPFGKGLPTLLTLCSFCILAICYFSCFPFWFLGRDLGSDCTSHCTGHCMLVTLSSPEPSGASGELKVYP